MYYREHAAGVYSSVPYSVAEVLVEIPYLIAQSMIYSLLVYWWVRPERELQPAGFSPLLLCQLQDRLYITCCLCIFSCITLQAAAACPEPVGHERATCRLATQLPRGLIPCCNSAAVLVRAG